MQKALQLLLDTQLGVKEIASQVGYESAASSSNAFKRCTGKAPAEFRKNGDAHQSVFADWIRRFVIFYDKRHPAQLGEPEVTRFLSHLAVEDRVSPSTQSQARAALVFLYRYVLERPRGPRDGVVRAQRPVPAKSSGAGRRVPDREEVLTAMPTHRG